MTRSEEDLLSVGIASTITILAVTSACAVAAAAFPFYAEISRDLLTAAVPTVLLAAVAGAFSAVGFRDRTDASPTVWTGITLIVVTIAALVLTLPPTSVVPRLAPPHNLFWLALVATLAAGSVTRHADRLWREHVRRPDIATGLRASATLAIVAIACAVAAAEGIARVPAFVALGVAVAMAWRSVRAQREVSRFLARVREGEQPGHRIVPLATLERAAASAAPLDRSGAEDALLVIEPEGSAYRARGLEDGDVVARVPLADSMRVAPITTPALLALSLGLLVAATVAHATPPPLVVRRALAGDIPVRELSCRPGGYRVFAAGRSSVVFDPRAFALADPRATFVAVAEGRSPSEQARLAIELLRGCETELARFVDADYAFVSEGFLHVPIRDQRFKGPRQDLIVDVGRGVIVSAPPQGDD